MSHHIAANFSLPNLANSVTSAATKAMSSTSGSSSASSSSSSSSMDASNIGSTFLQLLTQELQNQDPTAPMDSTAMVGQMISLNQLSQLVSINQTLGNATSTGTTSTGAVGAGTTAAALQAASGSASALAMMFPSSQLGLASTTGAAVQNPSATSLLALR